jgi:hypothetical protein
MTKSSLYGFSIAKKPSAVEGPTLTKWSFPMRHVLDTGLLEDIDLKIKIASSPSVTHEIFNEYMDTVSIAAVISNRDVAGCNRKPGVSLWDNNSPHCFDTVWNKLARHGIIAIAYPPHTPHVSQVLDVLLFGIVT